MVLIINNYFVIYVYVKYKYDLHIKENDRLFKS